MLSKENKSIISSALKYASIFIVVFWIIQLLQLIGFDFHSYGVLPRTKNGLIGVFTSPFIHGNIQHLIANTIPFFILSFLLFISHFKKGIVYLVLIWITTGFFTWIIGRSSWHIGASGIIYGLATFLVTSGILSKNWKLILVSITVFVLYYGLIWGIFPSERGISWEGHLSGFLSGIIWAFVFKNKLRNKSKF